MEVHDVEALTAVLPTLDLSTQPTKEEAMAAAPLLGSFYGCELRLARFSGQPPWERHPDDELIYVIGGAVTLNLLEDSGRRDVSLRPGSLCVVPGGVWHRSLAAESVTVLVATPAEGNDCSVEEDPRS